MCLYIDVRAGVINVSVGLGSYHNVHWSIDRMRVYETLAGNAREEISVVASATLVVLCTVSHRNKGSVLALSSPAWLVVTQV